MLAHEKGFQITSHAVGDRGVDIISRAIENALNAIPKNDHRNRIEHCAIINEELLERIKRCLFYTKFIGFSPLPQTDTHTAPEVPRCELHDIADAGVLVEPSGVVGAEPDAAMADIRLPLGTDRPRGGMNELTCPGDSQTTDRKSVV